MATPAVWGDRDTWRGPAGALADAGAMLRVAGRLLARHWPVLLALYLAGTVVRELVLRAAVQTSLLSSELGMLVLLLAPMATLAALALMLRAVRPSLPYLGGTGAAPSLLAHLGSVLVPFLTIYYFEDFLYQDISRYAGDVLSDDLERIGVAALSGDGDPADLPDRLPYQLTVTLVSVVALAFVCRWLLERWQARRPHAWLGLPAAYLELVWLTLVYVAFVAFSQWILAWGGNRQLTHAAQTVWDQAVGTLTGLSVPFASGYGWFVDQLAYVNVVLVVPVGWLAVGALVLGYQPRPVLGAGAVPARGDQLYDRAQQRWSRAPRPVRWAGEKVTEDMRGRFTPLVRGTRMLLRAGLAPMLLFCLAFVAVRTAADWLWELQRLLIGAQDPDRVWLPLSVPLEQLNEAVGYVLTVCLLAAAVDRAVHASEPAPQDTGPPDTTPPDTGPPAVAQPTSNRT